MPKDFFDEIPVKINRSHMQQAYLFDHIQPEMPAFNTKLFKLARPTYLEQHVYQATEHADKLNNDIGQRYDLAIKSYAKLKKGMINNPTLIKNINQLAKEESRSKDDYRSNKLDYVLLTNQVDSLCKQVDELGMLDEKAAGAQE